MDSKYCALFIVAIAFCSHALPVKGIHQEVGDIACNTCSSGNSSGQTTSGSGGVDPVTSDTSRDRTSLVSDLMTKVLESSSAAAAIVNQVYTAWTSLIRPDPNMFQQLRDFVAQHLTMSVNDSDGVLSLQERQLAHTLLQASRFVYFLDTNEHRTAYGYRAASLSDLKGRLQQVVCSARHLLARLSDDTIRGFIQQNTHMSALQTSQYRGAIQRVVCSVALQRMVSVLSDISL